jgi:hypothetical protein
MHRRNENPNSDRESDSDLEHRRDDPPDQRSFGDAGSVAS